MTTSNYEEKRTEERKNVEGLEIVGIYLDPRPEKDLSLGIVDLLDKGRDVFTGINGITAKMDNKTTRGIKLEIFKQEIMAEELLKKDGKYVLKFVIPTSKLLADMREKVIINRRQNYDFIYFKAVCCWVDIKQEVSRAGFQIKGDNTEVLSEFLITNFNH